MKTEWGKASIRLTLVAVLVAATPIVSLAQPDGQLWTVATVEVHHDMVQEFEELQKELSVAYKKAGMTTRFISQVVRGPSAEYRISSPVEKWADYDDTNFMAKALGEAGAARWVARVTKCVKNRSGRYHRDTPGSFDSTQRGENAQIGRLDDAPQSSWPLPPEYNDWLVNKWVPAMKAAGMDGVFYSRNAFGGNAREWSSIALVGRLGRVRQGSSRAAIAR